jgi:hypothetical protein
MQYAIPDIIYTHASRYGLEHGILCLRAAYFIFCHTASLTSSCYNYGPNSCSCASSSSSCPFRRLQFVRASVLVPFRRSLSCYSNFLPSFSFVISQRSSQCLPKEIPAGPCLSTTNLRSSSFLSAEYLHPTRSTVSASVSHFTAPGRSALPALYPL